MITSFELLSLDLSFLQVVEGRITARITASNLLIFTYKEQSFCEPFCPIFLVLTA